MHKAQQEGQDDDDETEGNSTDEFVGSDGRGDGAEVGTDDNDIDGEGEVDEEGFDGEEGNVKDDNNSQADLDENIDKGDDHRQDRRQKSSKFDRDSVKTPQRKPNNKFDDAGSNEDHSKSDFDSSHQKNMKMLKSTIRGKELPLRIAYEQLDELAASAELVRSAIEKNRSILNVQVKRSNTRYLRVAFAAWKLDLDWKKTKRRDIIQANAWQKKSLMLKAFKAWGKEHLAHVKLKRLQKSAIVIIQRHNMRRCWKAWIALIKEKLRDQEEFRKEKRLVKDMEYKYQEQICRRACNFMYRYRLRRIFLAFRESRARLQKRIFQQSFKAWKSEVRDARNRAENLEGLSLKSSANKQAVAFATWASLVFGKKANVEKLRRAILCLELKRMKSAFGAFVDGCSVSKHKSNIIKRIFRRMQTWRLNKAFQAWIYYMQIQAQKKLGRLQEHVVTIEKENDRLRIENDRLGHVIDSGNWGKDRITELIKARQVLTGERDALTRLLGRMQRHHSFSLDQQRKHEEEVQELKRQLMGKKHLVRNKLLVKGASSFNSLIKAMREDVLKNGDDPQLLYTIDKLAMDEVTVFPDGDLSVKHMTNFERGKGNWSLDIRPSSSSQARKSPKPTLSAPTTPTQSSSPTTKSFKERALIKAQTNDKEISPSQLLPTLSSRKTPGISRHARPKTPMRGRALHHFDYAQNTQISQEEAPAGIQGADQPVVTNGPHTNLGVINKYPSQSLSTPGSTPIS